MLSAGEVGRHGGELELHLVDGGAQAAQVEAEVGVLRERLEHARIVSKKRSSVQPQPCKFIFKLNIPKATQALLRDPLHSPVPDTSEATQALPCHRLHRPTARHLQGHPSPPLSPPSPSHCQTSPKPPKPTPVTPFTAPPNTSLATQAHPWHPLHSPVNSRALRRDLEFEARRSPSPPP